MSLDVYLEVENPIKRLSGTGVCIRGAGSTYELSPEGVRNLYPDAVLDEPVEYETNEVYSANITHNLNKMADAAGIYKHLWRPGEIGVTQARQLIEPLEAGLALLLADPDKFRQYNPANGWGDYNGLVQFVKAYLAACREYPDAAVRVSA